MAEIMKVTELIELLVDCEFVSLSGVGTLRGHTDSSRPEHSFVIMSTESENKRMEDETTLIATIREYDEDNGEIIEILYDGDESIILSNGEDPGIGRVPTLGKAVADIWASWRHWKTFEPCPAEGYNHGKEGNT